MAIFLWKKPGRISEFGKDAYWPGWRFAKRLHEMWRISWLGHCECNIMQCSMVSHWQLSNPAGEWLPVHLHIVGLPLLSYQNYTTGSRMTGFILDHNYWNLYLTCHLRTDCHLLPQNMTGQQKLASPMPSHQAASVPKPEKNNKRVETVLLILVLFLYPLGCVTMKMVGRCLQQST